MPRGREEVGEIMSRSDSPSDGRPLRLDANAQPKTPGQAAFLSRPDDAPVYHGFPILEGIDVAGWRLGVITELFGETEGDAFVVAPDGSRCGLVWEVDQKQKFDEIARPTTDRWGVFELSIPEPINNRNEARAWLQGLVELLRPRWDAWRNGNER